MAGLSSELYRRCRGVFMQCPEFDSNASLRSLFVTEELAPFANGLPEAGSKASRVDAALAYLIEKRLRDGRGALLLFVTVLRDRYDASDALWSELDTLLSSLLDTVEKRKGVQARVPKWAIGAFFGLLLGLCVILLYAWTQKQSPMESLSPAGIAAAVALTILGSIVGAWLERVPEGGHGPKPKFSRLLYWILTGLVIATVVMTGLVTVLGGRYRTRPSTTYFVVDATAAVSSTFDDVRQNVQIAASAIPSDSRTGLRVYGGDETSNSTCQDSRQLLKPSAYQEAQGQLDLALRGISPAGHSSLTGAMLEAIVNDLQEENRPVRLILVTSGIDLLCDPPAGDLLKDRAKDLGKNIDLFIISIGAQNDINHQMFESYAKAFHGTYLPLADAKLLPAIVAAVSLYGYYGYGYSSDRQSPTVDQ